jgi:GntR family transcriptional repressor for pyruvate dehydrogenase complex
MNYVPERTISRRRRQPSTDQVVTHVRNLINSGNLRPGDRLPAERDLAVQIGVSRPTVRAGLRALAAMGVVQSRHGSGTFIPSGPPMLGCEPLSFLAALHGFTREEMYEARRILEVGAAGLAAARATAEQLATMAEEVANLFSAMDDPQRFLVHDIDFHRTVAAASATLSLHPLAGTPLKANSPAEARTQAKIKADAKHAVAAADKNGGRTPGISSATAPGKVVAAALTTSSETRGAQAAAAAASAGPPATPGAVTPTASGTASSTTGAAVPAATDSGTATSSPTSTTPSSPNATPDTTSTAPSSSSDPAPTSSDTATSSSGSTSSGSTTSATPDPTPTQPTPSDPPPSDPATTTTDTSGPGTSTPSPSPSETSTALPPCDPKDPPQDPTATPTCVPPATTDPTTATP